MQCFALEASQLTLPRLLAYKIQTDLAVKVQNIITKRKRGLSEEMLVAERAFKEADVHSTGQQWAIDETPAVYLSEGLVNCKTCNMQSVSKL